MKSNKKIYMWPSAWEKPVVKGTYGAVSSNSCYATQAGLEILNKGGNAFDAAVAVSLVLSVVEEHHSGIGGGCFTLFYSVKDNETFALDGRGTAPKKATKDLFLKDGEVQDEWKDLGGQSVLVPGLLKTMDVLLKKYGTMELKEVVLPALKYAKEGFEIGYTYSLTMHDDSVQRKMNLSNEFKKLYLKEDKSFYKFGDIYRNEKIAKLLELISKNGIDIFYNGEIAEKIVNIVNKNGGCFIAEDLKEYMPKIRKVEVSTYRGYEIKSFSPPSSGATLIEMLNIIENKNIKDMGHNSAETIHILAEAMKLGFSDRNVVLADPDYAKINDDKLISKEYAKERYSLVSSEAKEYTSGNLSNIKEYNGNTSHFSIIDRYGNVVSQTQTIRDWFGSGIIVDDYGFVLNNGMSDFSALAGAITSQGLTYGDLNAIEGGKIPLSSMSPTIVFKDKKPFMSIGAAGGPRIITGILQGIINAIDYDMLPEQLVNMPFINCLTKNQGLEVEYGISKDTLNILVKKGHIIKEIPVYQAMSTMLNSVMNIDGVLYAASTKRVDGCGGVLFENGHIALEGIIQR